MLIKIKSSKKFSLIIYTGYCTQIGPANAKDKRNAECTYFPTKKTSSAVEKKGGGSAVFFLFFVVFDQIDWYALIVL